METEKNRIPTDKTNKNICECRRKTRMRIPSQTQVKDTTVFVKSSPAKDTESSKLTETENSLDLLMQSQENENKDIAIPKDKMQKAVNALNEFMTLQNQNSKFVLHDGLDRYYVQVVDSKTEEVIREVPPRKLLDAFYTMQKFLGMIIDEKI